MLKPPEAKQHAPSASTEALANLRSGPGVLVFTTSMQLLYISRFARELCRRINQSRPGKPAFGVLPLEITRLGDQILRMLRIWSAPKDWEEIKLTSLTRSLNAPILLTGIAIPDANGIKNARILVLLEEVGCRKGETAGQIKELYRLTTRETAVVLCLLQGKTNKEIAGDLGIQEQTVKEHIKNLLKKFNTTTRTGILSRLFHQGNDDGM
jgi:DNA-binding CsgD family transcriptional regulator